MPNDFTPTDIELYAPTKGGELTEELMVFCREFCGVGSNPDICECNAYQSALEAGFTDGMARQSKRWLLTNPDVQIYVATLLKGTGKALKARIQQKAGKALDAIDRLMAGAVSEQVQLAAARFILESAGHGPRKKLDITHDTGEQFNRRLDSIRHALGSGEEKEITYEIPTGVDEICTNVPIKLEEIEIEVEVKDVEETTGDPPEDTAGQTGEEVPEETKHRSDEDRFG